MMTVDRDFNIINVNESTMVLLKEHEMEFRTIWPSFRADEIVGSNIDMFHKKPSHQRNLLSDPKILPYRTDISIGELTFALNVSGVFDKDGEYIGNVLEWADVTEIRANEGARAAQIQAEKEQAIVVEQLATGLQLLAKGDLTKPINTEFADRYEQLRADFNSALEKLQDVVSEISRTSHIIRDETAQISSASDSLATRTEHQAATLEQTVAALTEITTAVKMTADNVASANIAATKTRKEAETGGKIILQAVNAMSEIQNSSGQISNISDMIENIAFQTNLLALNAGVEAARAGEAGKGFSVVAREVRALALRCSTAAKDIKELIAVSTKHVDSGVELVGQAGGALEKILGSIDNVAELISAITEAANEQSNNLSELNSSANTMDEVTQKNAAMVEETTAASHSLAEVADVLIRNISTFEIQNKGRGSRSRPGESQHRRSLPQAKRA